MDEWLNLVAELFLFMSFLLDQKGPKNQGPTEICLLVRLWREQSQ
jgi:hypothetical protein